MIASGIVVLLVIAAVIGIVFTKKAQKKKLDETAVVVHAFVFLGCPLCSLERFPGEANGRRIS